MDGGRFGDRAIGLGSAERVGANAAAVAITDSLRSRRIVCWCCWGCAACKRYASASDMRVSACHRSAGCSGMYAVTIEPRLLWIYAVVEQPGGAYSTHAAKSTQAKCGFLSVSKTSLAVFIGINADCSSPIFPSACRFLKPDRFGEKISVAIRLVLEDANCTKVRLSAANITWIYQLFNATTKNAGPQHLVRATRKNNWNPDNISPRAGSAQLSRRSQQEHDNHGHLPRRARARREQRR